MADVGSLLSTADATLFARPGDLHLERRDSPNFRVAEWMTKELNGLIKPDFVQFAGDNVQNARPTEFELFNELSEGLDCPGHPMVGDHDVHEDPSATTFQKYCGLTYKSFEFRGIRFIRLNTVEKWPLGFSDRQLDWMEWEIEYARQNHQRVIIFQHHYPFKILEEFEGPGIERWRRIVATYPIEAILCGHTHYGQIANDGRNLAIATRSIGDPEGGPPGYHLFYLRGDRFAATYREFADPAPLIMIVAPRDFILARNHNHVVGESFEIEALIWSRAKVAAHAVVDHGLPIPLTLDSEDGGNEARTRWRTVFCGTLTDGAHQLRVHAESEGVRAERTIEFFTDRTGRFTAIPRVLPWVSSTKFC